MQLPGGCGHRTLCANCPQCMQLQNQYYKKIKQIDPTWEDIEDTSHPHRPLLCWHSLKWKHIHPQRKEQIENYYQKARGLLHSYPFRSDLQRKVWELHSDGLSKEKIEKILESTEQNYKRSAIGLIIYEIAEELK